MADNGSISQNTIAQAGLAPSDMAYRDLMQTYGKRDDAMKQAAESAARVAPLQQAKADALAPKMDEAAAAAREKPPEAPKLEKSPDYQRPTVKPQDFQDQFGMMLAASMLVGVGSRQPFFDAMSGLTGAMKGYQAKDETLVKDSLAAFDRNLSALKERNLSARQEFDEAWKKYANNLPRLKQEIEILSAKYDMPIAAENARHASIDSVVKTLDGQIKSLQTAYEKGMSLAERERHDREQEKIERLRIAESNAIRRDAIAARTQASADKGWTLMKDKAGQVYRVNVNAGTQQKQTPQGWLEVGQLPPDVMRVGAKENQGRMFEEKAGMQYNTLLLATKELDALEKEGIKDMPFLADISFDSHGIASATGRFGQKRALTDKEQQMVTAAQLFAEAAGHLERGANLTDQQFQRVVREFIPQPGDKEGNLKQKKDHRKNILEGAKIVSGEVGAKIDAGKERESGENKKPTGNNSQKPTATNTPEEQKELEALEAAERERWTGNAVKGKITPRQ